MYKHLQYRHVGCAHVCKQSVLCTHTIWYHVQLAIKIEGKSTPSDLQFSRYRHIGHKEGAGKDIRPWLKHCTGWLNTIPIVYYDNTQCINKVTRDKKGRFITPKLIINYHFVSDIPNAINKYWIVQPCTTPKITNRKGDFAATAHPKMWKLRLNPFNYLAVSHSQKQARLAQVGRWFAILFRIRKICSQFFSVSGNREYTSPHGLFSSGKWWEIQCGARFSINPLGLRMGKHPA